MFAGSVWQHRPSGISGVCLGWPATHCAPGGGSGMVRLIQPGGAGKLTLGKAEADAVKFQ